MLRSIPWPLHRFVIASASRLAYHTARSRTHTARVNLDIAFGDTLDASEKKRIILRTYQNLFHLTLDTILNQGASHEAILSKVSFENPQILEDALASDRPIIFMTAHYGNWELGTLAIAAHFTPIHVVGRPLDWAWADRILTATREQFGIKAIPKKQAMKPMLQALKNRIPVGLVVDQNTSDRDGILVDFFGKKVRHTPAAALLARKTDALVIPVFSRTDDFRHWTITFYPPISVDRSSDIDEDIRRHVQAQAEITEKVIRQKPDEWFWLHQRWKNQYEELYR
ncbi:lipid A biosynthesis lauroyl acyltransferase [Nitratifractor sp.]